MLNVDMWYGDNYMDCDEISITFYPNDCEYRGNIYKDNKCIGDYVCDNSIELRKTFSNLHFNWN